MIATLDLKKIVFQILTYHIVQHPTVIVTPRKCLNIYSFLVNGIQTIAIVDNNVWNSYLHHHWSQQQTDTKSAKEELKPEFEFITR
jgi:hypothetical protein